ncbi:sulfotransferase [Qipengyuania soli]|uniref:Sulfotransferase n=1 Tax=Qipengyuania soli TaxID=2782568 RepID=A0A7S8IW00_9SPHN|nr:sulfotransferase [Qipengyuania soli]
MRPPRRSPFIDLLNATIRAGNKTGVIEKAPLQREYLLEKAVSDAGLNDFGDNWFETPMEVLLESLADEAHLNPAGEWSAEKQFSHVLRGRLLAQKWFRDHPEILARPISRPVVIVGPMRSGTTRLHRLLAADQRFSHLRSFETISPVPQPGFQEVIEGKISDPRPAVARRIMAIARLANPRTLSIHPTGPFEPEEELGLLVASMWGMKHEAQWRVPTYARWCEGQDATPAYQYMANLLRLIGWSQQTSSNRPWLLKTPQHMLDLPALLKVFPDARLIFTHRDPVKLVGSAASLAWNQTIIYSDKPDPQKVGREWLRKTELKVQRMQEARQSILDSKTIDVHYDDIDRDWLGAMKRVYGFLELDIGPALTAMKQYLSRSAKLKRRPHRYSLGEFGITDSEVRERFSNYSRTFDVPFEARTAPPSQFAHIKIGQSLEQI